MTLVERSGLRNEALLRAQREAQVLQETGQYPDSLTRFFPENEGYPAVGFSRQEGGKRFVYSIDPISGERFTTYTPYKRDDNVVVEERPMAHEEIVRFNRLACTELPVSNPRDEEILRRALELEVTVTEANIASFVAPEVLGAELFEPHA